MNKYHMIYLAFVIFRESVEEGDLKNENSRVNLLNLGRIFALKQLMEDS